MQQKPSGSRRDERRAKEEKVLRSLGFARVMTLCCCLGNSFIVAFEWKLYTFLWATQEEERKKGPKVGSRESFT